MKLQKNTEYEGKIKSYGDTVIVRTTPDITINDYVIGQNLTYQRPESLPIEMKIDQGKYSKRVPLGCEATV